MEMWGSDFAETVCENAAMSAEYFSGLQRELA